jgi:hypothetical protein
MVPSFGSRPRVATAPPVQPGVVADCAVEAVGEVALERRWLAARCVLGLPDEAGGVLAHQMGEVL